MRKLLFLTANIAIFLLGFLVNEELYFLYFLNLPYILFLSYRLYGFVIYNNNISFKNKYFKKEEIEEQIKKIESELETHKNIRYVGDYGTGKTWLIMKLLKYHFIYSKGVFFHYHNVWWSKPLKYSFFHTSPKIAGNFFGISLDLSNMSLWKFLYYIIFAISEAFLFLLKTIIYIFCPHKLETIVILDEPDKENLDLSFINKFKENEIRTILISNSSLPIIFNDKFFTATIKHINSEYGAGNLRFLNNNNKKIYEDKTNEVWRVFGFDIKSSLFPYFKSKYMGRLILEDMHLEKSNFLDRVSKNQGIELKKNFISSSIGCDHSQIDKAKLNPLESNFINIPLPLRKTTFVSEQYSFIKTFFEQESNKRESISYYSNVKEMENALNGLGLKSLLEMRSGEFGVLNKFYNERLLRILINIDENLDKKEKNIFKYTIRSLIEANKIGDEVLGLGKFEKLQYRLYFSDKIDKFAWIYFNEFSDNDIKIFQERINGMPASKQFDFFVGIKSWNIQNTPVEVIEKNKEIGFKLLEGLEIKEDIVGEPWNVRFMKQNMSYLKKHREIMSDSEVDKCLERFKAELDAY